MASRKRPRKRVLSWKKLKAKRAAKASKPVKYASVKLKKAFKPLKMKMPFSAALTLERLEKNLGKKVFMKAEYRSPHRVDRELDERIEKAARHKSYASGFGFDDGVRDVSFDLTTKQAFGAAQRIKKALPKVKVRFISAEDL